MPATELKIDRSFVQLILTNRSDATMVDSTIKLAHALGLKVVAEGVENKEVYDKLASMECDIVQGYYLSRPLTFDDFSTFYEHKLGTKKGRRVRA
jgi:EAL domain-containing protein (putative c-di-GMP-specific phosphodiesterase class I)